MNPDSQLPPREFRSTLAAAVWLSGEWSWALNLASDHIDWAVSHVISSLPSSEKGSLEKLLGSLKNGKMLPPMPQVKESNRSRRPRVKKEAHAA